MSPYMRAARTNLTSDRVKILSHVIGEGSFRTCLAGIYVGGNRNGQHAACKRFKRQFRNLEDEFFAYDFKVLEKVAMIATDWNEFCDHGNEILINSGTIHKSNSKIQYLVEPFIKDYERFTSNTGWIGDPDDWAVRCLEAFTHYSYHHTGGEMIVCDLQGRYRKQRKKRFELSDPAISSRSRQYGLTDMGEKGIDSFFANHRCNEFCHSKWARPSWGESRHWFPAQSTGTMMLSSQYNSMLRLDDPTHFRDMRQQGGEQEWDSDYDDDDNNDDEDYDDDDDDDDDHHDDNNHNDNNHDYWYDDDDDWSSDDDDDRRK